MFAKTEEINAIKMEFNMGRCTVYSIHLTVNLSYDIQSVFLLLNQCV